MADKASAAKKEDVIRWATLDLKRDGPIPHIHNGIPEAVLLEAYRTMYGDHIRGSHAVVVSEYTGELATFDTFMKGEGFAVAHTTEPDEQTCRMAVFLCGEVTDESKKFFCGAPEIETIVINMGMHYTNECIRQEKPFGKNPPKRHGVRVGTHEFYHFPPPNPEHATTKAIALENLVHVGQTSGRAQIGDFNLPNRPCDFTDAHTYNYVTKKLKGIERFETPVNDGSTLRINNWDSTMRFSKQLPGYLPIGYDISNATTAPAQPFDRAYNLSRLAASTMTGTFLARPSKSTAAVARSVLQNMPYTVGLQTARAVDAGKSYAETNKFFAETHAHLVQHGNLDPLLAALYLIEGDHVAKRWHTKKW